MIVTTVFKHKAWSRFKSICANSVYEVLADMQRLIWENSNRTLGFDKGKVYIYIIAKRVHPSAQTSVRSSISHWLGQSQSSGALYGAEQCSAAHSCDHLTCVSTFEPQTSLP